MLIVPNEIILGVCTSKYCQAKAEGKPITSGATYSVKLSYLIDLNVPYKLTPAY